MITFPNAKINLGLHVTAKRADGYHDLESIFVPVPWEDMLELVPAKKTSFTATGIAIDGNSDSNLVMQAYHLLKEKHDLPPIAVHLHKIIPIGAGLGGGSADAAFMLKLLNAEFELKLSDEELEQQAKKLGSDCAFFIQNTPRYCFGKGDEFEEINLSLKGLHIIMVYPDLHITTAEAYSGITTAPSTIDFRTLKLEDIRHWRTSVVNDFERHLFPKYPQLRKVKEQLYETGAAYASMSGSGSTVYGLFEEKPDIKGLFPQAFSVHQAQL